MASCRLSAARKTFCRFELGGREPYLVLRIGNPRLGIDSMKDFSNASFPPETIGIMKDALNAAIATLPDPVSSAHVNSIAETILRTANEGEREPPALQRMALMELQISPRNDATVRTE
jgi:hypothetical protein